MRDINRYLLDNKISGLKQHNHFDRVNKMIYANNNYENQDVFSKLLDDRIIFLTTDVSSDVCAIIKAQLLYLESISDSDIKLYIDSPGGEIYTGLGLLDVMDLVKPDIETVNIGLCASMGAILLCSGTKGKRRALKRSRTMIHQPLSGFGDYQQATEMSILVKEVNSLKKELIDILSEATGKSKKIIADDCERDFWMTSHEAKIYGLIDEVVNGK